MKVPQQHSLVEAFLSVRPDQGPGAQWICVHPEANIWLWQRAPVPSESGADLEALGVQQSPKSSSPTAPDGYQRAEGAPATWDVILMSRFADVRRMAHPRMASPTQERQAQNDGAQHTSATASLATTAYPTSSSAARSHLWAPPQALASAAAVPVILAFRLPENARASLPELPQVNGTSALPMAQVLPPPQMGEVGLVVHGDAWKAYALSALGDEALELWRRLGAALSGLAYPGEWWAHTDLLAHCAVRDWYLHERTALEAALSATPQTRSHAVIEQRRRLRDQLGALATAHRFAVALDQATQRALADTDSWLARLAEIETMATRLAEMYYAAHLDNASSMALSLVLPEGTTDARRYERSRKPTAQGSATAPVTVKSTPDRASNHVNVAKPSTEQHNTTESDEQLIVSEAGVPAAFQASLWEWEADWREGLAVLARTGGTSHLVSIGVPAFSEDRAVREASLADKALWTREAGALRYLASNNLGVYFLDPSHPVPVSEAQSRLAQIRESTVLTARIVLGLWNVRRQEGSLTTNGFAPISIDEILELRGVQKHMRPAYPGASADVSDGYRTEHKDAVRQDLLLLRNYYLRGTHTIRTGSQDRAQDRQIVINGPYLQVTTAGVATPTQSRNFVADDPNIEAVLVSPGGWIEAYGPYADELFAEVDRRVFQLNPQNDRHELLLALYLMERWRGLALTGSYDEPITMARLLQESVIPVNTHNLTSRFVPRIESALETLREREIIGYYECLTPVDKQKKGHWGRDWLASRWRIVPPNALVQQYARHINTTQTPHLPKQLAASTADAIRRERNILPAGRRSAAPADTHER